MGWDYPGSLPAEPDRHRQPSKKQNPEVGQNPAKNRKYFIAIHVTKRYSAGALISFCDPKRNRRPQNP
jgi:hypothetical protein